MKSPEIDPKSPLASPSYHDESSRRVEEDPSDSPRRFSCSCPRSGLSRTKVDVIRRRFHPKICTVPSATGSMNFSPFIGVSTSFALSLRAWSFGASISSNSSMSATIMSHFQILPRVAHSQRNIPCKTFLPN